MKHISYLLLSFTFLIGCQQQHAPNSFAIVIDPQSYEAAKQEVDNYAQSIEKDGLKTVLIIDQWNHPDSIKTKLISLYNDQQNPLEGAVFIGDIPVPMVRHAQHFAGAFKMDEERYAWDRSSIPSDRFYDDFDLEFDFIKQDTVNKLCFYYELSTNSPQSLKSDIYTGRIKPWKSDHQYSDLKAYLQKVVKIKAENNAMDNLVFFAGHGYNSESMLVRMDEKINLMDHFPWLKSQQNGLQFINHDMEVHIKDRLMGELQKPDMDMAILHHHGAPDMQYLNGMPNVSGVTQQIDGIKYYLRSKLRYAKRKGQDLTETKQRYHETYGVPIEWFDGTFDETIETEDSIYNASLDISVNELSNYTPNARFIILDACFNGSFQNDEYIAGGYIFNNGNTVAVHANTVSSLQDNWINEMIGLIGLGTRIGNWAKLTNHIETHIIGDPTFHFSNSYSDIAINDELNVRHSDTSYWLKQLDSEFPAVQALALRMLKKNGYENLSELLLDTFQNSQYATVRMECLKLLTALNDDRFIECLQLAANDNNEMVKRQATYLMGKSGDPRLVKTFLLTALDNNISKRVNFDVKQQIGMFDKDVMLDAYPDILANLSYLPQKPKTDSAMHEQIVYYAERWEGIATTLMDSSESAKSKKRDLRMLRNYNYHPGVAAYCDFVKTTDDTSLKIIALEALGWFNISWKKNLIIETCKSILNDPDQEEGVRNEAQRTLNRIKTEWTR